MLTHLHLFGDSTSTIIEVNCDENVKYDFFGVIHDNFKGFKQVHIYNMDEVF